MAEEEASAEAAESEMDPAEDTPQAEEEADAESTASETDSAEEMSPAEEEADTETADSETDTAEEMLQADAEAVSIPPGSVLDVMVKQLGHKAADAKQMITNAMQRNESIATAEELFDEVYKGEKMGE